MIYYVNAAAPRDGNGSKQMPFKHINTAAKIARPGDVVSVAPGVYREYVNPVHAGREDARIEYHSEKPLGARITGAELRRYLPRKIRRKRHDTLSRKRTLWL